MGDLLVMGIKPSHLHHHQTSRTEGTKKLLISHWELTVSGFLPQTWEQIKIRERFLTLPRKNWTPGNTEGRKQKWFGGIKGKYFLLTKDTFPHIFHTYIAHSPLRSNSPKKGKKHYFNLAVRRNTARCSFLAATEAKVPGDSRQGGFPPNHPHTTSQPPHY